MDLSGRNAALADEPHGQGIGAALCERKIEAHTSVGRGVALDRDAFETHKRIGPDGIKRGTKRVKDLRIAAEGRVDLMEINREIDGVRSSFRDSDNLSHGPLGEEDCDGKYDND